MSRPPRQIRRAGTRSERVKKEQVFAAGEQERRAAERLAIARFGSSVEGSLTVRWRAVARAVDRDAIPGVRRVPSRSTVAELVAKFDGGARAVEDYRDAPRSGRPRTRMDERLAARAREALSRGEVTSLLGLHALLREPALALGLAPPRYWMVRRDFGAHIIRRTAARYGVLAAETDAVPHAVVPAAHTHDVWTLDELLLPNWCRVWNRVRHMWQSIRPWVVLVVDVGSRVAVAALVVDPGRRTDPETGEPAPQAVTKEDVLAALLSAGCRELAPAATSAYAGSCPRTIRWDQAGPHLAHEAALRRIGVECRRLRRRRPPPRGAVERPIDTVKQWCVGLEGSDERVVPTDQPASDRAPEVNGVREAQRTLVDPAELPSIPEMQAALGDVVRRYNEQHTHRRLGVTPHDAFHIRRAADALPGRNLLTLLQPEVVRVGGHGIVHSRDGGPEVVYAAFTETLIIQRDVLVEARVDPWQRGLFVRVGATLQFLEPNATWSAASGAARTARLRSAAPQAAADQAAEVRAADRSEPAPATSPDASPEELPSAESPELPFGGQPEDGAGWLDPLERLRPRAGEGEDDA